MEDIRSKPHRAMHDTTHNSITMLLYFPDSGDRRPLHFPLEIMDALFRLHFDFDI